MPAAPGTGYFLKSVRLGFRCWSPDDLPLAISLCCDPDVMRFIGGPYSRAEVQERVAREMACQQANGFQYWPVFLLEGSEFAGCCGLRPYHLDEKIFTLGFHFRPAFWGRGLAEEAGRTIIDYSFGTLGARKLFAGRHPENAGSHRVLEKLGFRRDGEALFARTGLLHLSYWLFPKT